MNKAQKKEPPRLSCLSLKEQQVYEEVRSRLIMEQPKLWHYKTFLPVIRPCLTSDGGLEYGWMESSDMNARKCIIYMGLIFVNQPVTEETPRRYLLNARSAVKMGWRVDF